MQPVPSCAGRFVFRRLAMSIGGDDLNTRPEPEDIGELTESGDMWLNLENGSFWSFSVSSSWEPADRSEANCEGSDERASNSSEPVRDWNDEYASALAGV